MQHIYIKPTPPSPSPTPTPPPPATTLTPTATKPAKKTFKDANFPLDPDGRTYHVGTKRGELAPRILTVGDPSRARLISQYLNQSPPPLWIESKRGFITITGTYKETPVSIVAIGMGLAMMDFFVRECRAVVDGPMCVIRFGSCGSISTRCKVGQVAVVDECVLVTREVDYFGVHVGAHGDDEMEELKPYRFSKPVLPDEGITSLLHQKLSESLGPQNVSKGLNATADSFYSSQGRIDPRFNDFNSTLIDDILKSYQNANTLEMETFSLFHLARCAGNKNLGPVKQKKVENVGGGDGVVVDSVVKTKDGKDDKVETNEFSIRAAAAMMVFAGRKEGDFILPEVVESLEKEAGKACLEALVAYVF
ncbi:hypothetical protein HDU76_006691 [Blyttiomyces sp. JEL0837]|nr:hypothetical protein HDU76_006691 [Blyttiomyces sp. JEL0837]